MRPKKYGLFKKTIQSSLFAIDQKKFAKIKNRKN